MTAAVAAVVAILAAWACRAARAEGPPGRLLAMAWLWAACRAARLGELVTGGPEVGVVEVWVLK